MKNETEDEKMEQEEGWDLELRLGEMRESMLERDYARLYGFLCGVAAMLEDEEEDQDRWITEGASMYARIPCDPRVAYDAMAWLMSQPGPVNHEAHFISGGAPLFPTVFAEHQISKVKIVMATRFPGPQAMHDAALRYYYEHPKLRIAMNGDGDVYECEDCVIPLKQLGKLRFCHLCERLWNEAGELVSGENNESAESDALAH